MRPRKTLLPLTLDNLTHELEPGRAYTADALCMIFDGSKHAMHEVLETAVAAGSMMASKPRRGFRRTYWVPYQTIERSRPALMTTELTGHTERIFSFVRLCMAGPRG